MSKKGLKKISKSSKKEPVTNPEEKRSDSVNLPAPSPGKRKKTSPSLANSTATKELRKALKKNNTKPSPEASTKSAAQRKKKPSAENAATKPKRSPLSPASASAKPSLRSLYVNSKNTLMPLGFGTDFKTKNPVVIFSDLSNGQVHTTPLAAWNRMKLRELKELPA